MEKKVALDLLVELGPAVASRDVWPHPNIFQKKCLVAQVLIMGSDA